MAWIASDQPKTRSVPFGGTRDYTALAARAFLGRVYRFMSLGLAVTGLTALLTASSPAVMGFVFGNQGVFLGLVIAQLIMVMAFAPVATRVRASTAALMFFGYSALSGVTFASIFLLYKGASIASTFLVTAGMFAGISA